MFVTLLSCKLISISMLFMSCGNETTENELNVSDTLLELKIDSMGIDTSGIIFIEDSVMEKMSFLMKSTENAHTKVKEIKVLKVENKVLKHDLIETKEQLIIAKEEIKKLDSTITSTKKKGLLQRIVDNFKDTIK
jgi:hypothetical protein